jgi:hypothetical protein
MLPLPKWVDAGSFALCQAVIAPGTWIKLMASSRPVIAFIMFILNHSSRRSLFDAHNDFRL